MSELMMSSPHYLPYILYIHFWKFNILPKLVIVCFAYQDILELTLFYIYSERNWGKSNVLLAEIWNFCHFCIQSEWKIVRRWHHQLAHLHIHSDWSRTVSWKFAKFLNFITSLFSTNFHQVFTVLFRKFLLFLLENKVNLFRITSLSKHEVNNCNVLDNNIYILSRS